MNYFLLGVIGVLLFVAYKNAKAKNAASIPQAQDADSGVKGKAASYVTNANRGDPRVKQVGMRLGPDISIRRVPTSTIDNSGRQRIS